MEQLIPEPACATHTSPALGMTRIKSRQELRVLSLCSLLLAFLTCRPFVSLFLHRVRCVLLSASASFAFARVEWAERCVGMETRKRTTCFILSRRSHLLAGSGTGSPNGARNVRLSFSTPNVSPPFFPLFPLFLSPVF